MTKKIIRITLCVFSFIGIFLAAASAALRFSPDPALSLTVSAGLGINDGINDYKQTLASPPLHLNIDLPRDKYTPLAMELYDSLPPETDGQDPPDEPDTTPSLPANTFPIIPLDLSDNQAPSSIVYINESKYTPDVNSLINNEYPIKYTKTVSDSDVFEPLVLIIHTHGTECYTPEGQDTYTPDTPTRSENTETNVVAVGRTLYNTLTEAGVPTVHCEIMFDAQSYSDSYDLSEKAVMEYLAKYPSIQYVFDVHRDSIVRENNEKIKPVVEINGKLSAQAMLVVGTDSSGADHPNWMDNLTVASYFQHNLIQKYGNIMRPINLRSASFNAEHTPGSILIEVGTCGNTIEEAQYCVSLLGDVIAYTILNDGNS